tara:strand:+ start:971 stop:1357 length:387 start_codon:yes stop_codon:yes gene_type:complete
MSHTILINAGYDLNESMQIGDTVYYSNVQSSQGGRNHPLAGHDSKPKPLGTVSGIDRVQLEIYVDSFSNNQTVVNNIVQSNPYLFFSKDRRVNYSGIIGYFMEVEYRNHSTLKSEIFATAVDYVNSSR